MTKTEATVLGEEKGDVEFARCDTQAMLAMSRDEVRRRVTDVATDHAAKEVGRAKLAVEAFTNAFVGRFMRRWSTVYEAQPEVIAQRKVESFNYAIANALSSAQMDLDKFSGRWAENPLYALEWSDSAFQAAARKDVALRLKEIAEARGVDEALKYAKDQALQGAMYPSHSTSQPSNLAKTYVTAAYAEYVRR